jgi:DNA polymerase-1
MLLTHDEFAQIAIDIANAPGGHVGFDFETTGLSPYKGARAFIMGFTLPNGEKHSVSLLDGPPPNLSTFFSNRRLKYCAHNAKFEMSFLKKQFRIEIQGVVWCTETLSRVAYDKPFTVGLSFSLQACAERFGSSKYAPMLAWLKQKGNKNGYHFAPRDLIIPYVEQDAWISWELCRQQIEVFKHWDKSSVPIKPVVGLEINTTAHLFDMEFEGLRVDTAYCERALAHEKKEIAHAKAAFEVLACVPFVDSRKTLAPVFNAHGIAYGRTEKGNASFTEENINSGSESPIVRALLKYRGATKRASSYWENFLELEHNGVIHPTINQNKAATGRMSIRDPSCQNWPTDEAEEGEPEPDFPVRRAFIAEEDCLIVSIDFSQMELRKIVDESGDINMIAAFLEGRDFHQETANLARVRRSLAKNGRFAKLYGASVKRVALTLGIDLALAQVICDAIDQSAPRVAAYTNELMWHAKRNAYGWDYLGRRFYFERGFEYKYPNYRIQGGCGEILRNAIVSVGNFLKEKRTSPRTRILIPVHDELVLNIHRDDMHLIPEIKRLMIAAHTDKQHLAMDVSVAVGPNFHDLEEWKDAS